MKRIKSPIPATPAEQKFAEAAKAQMEDWKARYAPLQPTIFSAALAGHAAGVYAASLGQPTKHEEDRTHCKGCGAPLEWVNFGRHAKCSYCKTEYRA